MYHYLLQAHVGHCRQYGDAFYDNFNGCDSTDILLCRVGFNRGEKL